jgi:hypothetical protein
MKPKELHYGPGVKDLLKALEQLGVELPKIPKRCPKCKSLFPVPGLDAPGDECPVCKKIKASHE